MTSILCLAHYCDTHGPTPLMVTEALPVGCTSCFETDDGFRRLSTSSRSITAFEGLVGGATPSAGRTNSSSSDKENGAQRVALQKQSAKLQTSFPAAFDTPPESPRAITLQSAQNLNSHKRDSSFRKTYDENDKKRAIPCENCALTLPRKTNEDSPTRQGMNAMIDNSPILRTRKPFELVAIPHEASPPQSDSSNNSESESKVKPRWQSPHLARVGTSSSNSSFTSMNSHTHYLDYTSTHEPLAPASFSMIRQSCLRLLSCETLPPSSTSTTTSPSSPFSPSATGTSSGGPIFFGDPLAGYTTAFVFRIPDPTARGRRRLYALMTLSTHHERLSMKPFSKLSAAFHDLAAWIQSLAESELERSESALKSPYLSDSSRNTSNNNTPTSAFLSGRNRGPDGRYSGVSLKARGLAELVGMPDFFIELHARFVRLLIELGLLLGTRN